jgi:hypothetical protein
MHDSHQIVTKSGAKQTNKEADPENKKLSLSWGWQGDLAEFSGR